MTRQIERLATSRQVTFARPLTIGLLNNMPDGALRSTEQQYAELLRAASPGASIALRLFSSAAVGRVGWPVGSTGAAYGTIDDLLDASPRDRPLDAMIVTGMAPQAADLRDEPVWDDLVRLAGWAEENGVPVVWSCLAAHVVVRHFDGIARLRLPAKLSGIFDCGAARPDHPLLAGFPPCWATPHSRYHGVAENALLASGYEILSRAAEAGTDMFLRRGNALFLFCQGHPEYHADTLLREYKRDMRLYFSGARDELPRVPTRYFDQATEAGLTRCRDRAMGGARDPALLDEILGLLRPAAGACHSSWWQSASCLYANWLVLLAAEAASPPRFAAPAADMSRMAAGHAAADPRGALVP